MKDKPLPPALRGLQRLGLADQVIEGQNAFAEHCGASTRCVRDWQALGMPHLKFANVCYYKLYEVLPWLKNYYRLRSGWQIGRCKKCGQVDFVLEFQREYQKKGFEGTDPLEKLFNSDDKSERG